MTYTCILRGKQVCGDQELDGKTNDTPESKNRLQESDLFEGGRMRRSKYINAAKAFYLLVIRFVDSLR
jgi:hypothetical protein